ncbi:methyltransferase [Candidatus Woesearchaeota archaeon]|nr:methyltransferase [Candidatus Woesearchaeota archaeon]
MSVYPPREDSELLLRWLPRLLKPGDRVLDMGTGSGVLAVAAAKLARSVVAADISARAVKATRAAGKGMKNLRVVRSDLFSGVTVKFDVILFNPPYLPQDQHLRNPALFGGKRGHETLCRFLDAAPGHLAPDGSIVVVFSSLTGKERIEQEARRLALEMDILEEEKLWFERLYCARVRRSALRTALEKRGFRDIALFARGKRGIVYIASRRGRKYAVKAENPASKATGRLENEARWLRTLNRKGIGPRLRDVVDGMLVLEFIEGKPLLDWMAGASSAAMRRIIRDVLRQLLVLDSLGVNKEEMHWPVKHVIVRRSRPVLIDFERCRRTLRPKNVTQFLQFLSTARVQRLAKGWIPTSAQLHATAKDYAKGGTLPRGIFKK